MLSRADHELVGYGWCSTYTLFLKPFVPPPLDPDHEPRHAAAWILHPVVGELILGCPALILRVAHKEDVIDFRCVFSAETDA